MLAYWMVASTESSKEQERQEIHWQAQEFLNKLKYYESEEKVQMLELYAKTQSAASVWSKKK